ncbi:hypothetical protein O1M63_48945 [Streptomyces mirabilis]|nr:hypothetical protein [Streptomyces mirabilis]
MWWIPTGPLTALPLHAAGRHENDGDNLLDRAVSSYAPTVNSLVHARRRQTAGPDRRPTVPTAPLVVAVPAPPGAGSCRWRARGRRPPCWPRDRAPVCSWTSRRYAGPCSTRSPPPLVHFACHAVAADGGPRPGRSCCTTTTRPRSPHRHRPAPAPGRGAGVPLGVRDHPGPR